MDSSTRENHWDYNRHGLKFEENTYISPNWCHAQKLGAKRRRYNWIIVHPSRIHRPSWSLTKYCNRCLPNKKTLLRVAPTLSYYSDILSGIFADILSGILSHICSARLSNVLSHSLPGIYADILSYIHLCGIYSDISIWRSILHLF